MRALTSAEWRQLYDAQQRNDRVAYWRVLQNAGDRYAFLAGEVVFDVSAAGRAANRHLAAIGSSTGEPEHRFTPANQQARVHQFGVALLQADLDERVAAAGAGSLTELMDRSSGAAGRAAAPILSATAVRDSHAVAALASNVTPNGWTMEAVLAGFQNNPAAMNQIWDRFVGLTLGGRPVEAGNLLRHLTEGLIYKAEGMTAPQIEAAVGRDIAALVALADVTGTTAGGTPIVDALRDTYDIINRADVIGAALFGSGDFIPEGMHRYRAMVEHENLRHRAAALATGTPPRCFLPGTPILMADGSEKPIEQVRIGDLVLAFDPAAALGRGALVPRPVTRTFQNITQTIIDLRGTRMTPGHVCLTDHGRFETIAAILARDGALIDKHGTPLRARTGARLGSPEDTQVAIVFTDPATGENHRVTLRAGIPCLTRIAADGAPETLSLIAALDELGATILPDGRLQDAEGRIGTSTDWPAGTTPLDTHAQRNWIVTGPDGQPYTPGWIAELQEEAAQEQAIGATTRRITASLGSAAAHPMQVGAWAATLPRIGSAVPRLH